MFMEGTGISKLRQMIKKHGYNEYDRFELATITSISPTIVKLDGAYPLELDAHDIIFAEHLTDRTVTMSSDGGVTFTEYFVKSPLSVGDRVIAVSTSGGQTFVVLDRAVMV